ncbi:hypothetical protein KDW82_08170 [Burkholderia vietnamiensis]|uniref:hypothetical protein n=1 Tax=Burkholderia vietnamiensis TaxID=60552 RepID=UPI001B8F3835|nr:hypothetical protein [Burkholderia vietnamiensis]MBR8189032.1 hypothetical protein [Burkholderia vietnamiensis]
MTQRNEGIGATRPRFLVTVKMYDGSTDYYECEADDDRDARQQAGWVYLRIGRVVRVTAIDQPSVDILQETDPRPIAHLDPDRPLYDEAGREYQVVAHSSTQVVTKTQSMFGVWDRKTGECLIANCEGARLSNEKPSAEWIARRRAAAIDVLSGLHAAAAIGRAQASSVPGASR